jgi:hypothetical protein
VADDDDSDEGCIVHVAPAGANVSGCGSSASPCATISAGLDQAQSSCTVSVASGTYSASRREPIRPLRGSCFRWSSPRASIWVAPGRQRH